MKSDLFVEATIGFFFTSAAKIEQLSRREHDEVVPQDRHETIEKILVRNHVSRGETTANLDE